jgi:hypothetical protein
MTETTTMKQRSTDERVVELGAKIAGIRARDPRRKAKAKPEVRFAIAATKALDTALEATADAPLRKAFQEARTIVAAMVAVEGLVVAASTAGEKPRGRKKSAAA